MALKRIPLPTAQLLRTKLWFLLHVQRPSCQSLHHRSPGHLFLGAFSLLARWTLWKALYATTTETFYTILSRWYSRSDGLYGSDNVSKYGFCNHLFGTRRCIVVYRRFQSMDFFPASCSRRINRRVSSVHLNCCVSASMITQRIYSFTT